MLLKNGKVLSNHQLIELDIRTQADKISEMASHLIPQEGEEVIDCQNKVIVPGFIDVHVHLREPGGEHKETIETGSKAAARGGWTTICAMPNTNPVPDNLTTLNQIQSKIEASAQVKVLPYAAISKGLKGEELVDFNQLGQAGIFAFTDDGVGVQTAGQMYLAMKAAAAVQKPIVAHTEDNSLLFGGGCVHEGDVSQRLGLNGMLGLTESVQIARDVLLAEATGCHYHVCHVSTKESVRVIRDAKAAGIHVTAEVTPHHLCLDENHILAADPNFKMNPPLRSVEDRQALITGLLDGTIDMIATDHAPHSAVEKAKGIESAPFGIVGSEIAFQLLYTKFVLSGLITLQQLVDWMSLKPAEVFGLEGGHLVEGGVADITVLDLEAEFKVDSQKFYSKSTNTPFEGLHLQSDIAYTIVNGKIAYQA